MIAVDTNILARFYCDDPDDPEAARQRPRARRAMIDSPAIFVPLTVVLEFE
jgi:predicted nucleic-acid-binding protein